MAFFTWGAAESVIGTLSKNDSLAASIKNYQSALGQPTNRKLALLVGINRYPHHEDLAGSLMDLELQRELLIHRFGFQPQDILTLSDRQATRDNIETAFIEHLTKQAQPDDVVVFHFSGYGNQIKMPLVSDVEAVKSTQSETQQVDAYRLTNSLVPVDGLSSRHHNQVANSILQETLLLLAQSLATTRFTFVLDTCFNNTPRSQHSSLRVRSIPQPTENPGAAELDFQSQLKDRLAVKGIKPSKRIAFLPGVILSATSNNRVAVERQWDNLNAGLFTQALTQHLWHLTPSSKIQVVLNRTAATVEQVMGRQQQPTLNNADKSAIAYYSAMSDVSGAVGIVSKVNGNSVEVKLLGFPINILESYGVGSCLSVVTPQESPSPQLQLKSKSGLNSKTQLLSPDEVKPQVGQLLQESIRIIEPDLSLNLALDDDLERIERVDATSALAGISAPSSTLVAKEHNPDCLLGKVASDNMAGEAESSAFSYGLYTAGGNLISKTTGLEDEAVKIAIDRLQPQFKNLLAVKWLKLSLNEFSSRLNARVTFIAGEEADFSSWQKATLSANDQPAATTSSLSSSSPNSKIKNNLPLITKGTQIRLALENSTATELYTIVLGTDCNSNLFALHTPSPSSSKKEVLAEDLKLTAAEELLIPSWDSSWQWKVPESTGINTLYVVLSVKPFTRTRKILAEEQNFQPEQSQLLKLGEPVAVIKALINDLHHASAVNYELLPNEDVYALDVTSWATLDFVYEVTSS